MKWIAISGSWRKMNKKLEKDVRGTVRRIISRGDGIIAGGALNVDYIAIDEALKSDSTAKRMKIFLPATLEIFSAHYRKRVEEGIITKKQSEDLIVQLNRVREINPSSLIENKKNKILNEVIYHQRNSEIIKAADGLIAFHVNQTVGVEDAISKAHKKGIPVKVFIYTIE